MLPLIILGIGVQAELRHDRALEAPPGNSERKDEGEENLEVRMTQLCCLLEQQQSESLARRAAINDRQRSLGFEVKTDG